MDREQEKLELKKHIIKYLNLLHVTPEEITDDMPMFREGLGLDSIDSIEMVVMMEREYGLKIENPKDGRDILQTINSMMDFIDLLLSICCSRESGSFLLLMERYNACNTARFSVNCCALFNAPFTDKRKDSCNTGL